MWWVFKCLASFKPLIYVLILTILKLLRVKYTSHLCEQMCLVVELNFWDSLFKQIAVLYVGSNTIKLLPPPLKLVATGGFFILLFRYFPNGSGFFHIGHRGA